MSSVLVQSALSKSERQNRLLYFGCQSLLGRTHVRRAPNRSAQLELLELQLEEGVLVLGQQLL